MRIALVGNPNTGKSSIFNMLTGLRQHVGNFPGITVDIKQGKFETDTQQIELVDLPGTYSIYPRSEDERVVYRSLTEDGNAFYPDAILAVIDASNLERNLLLASQVYDLGLPTVFVLNMNDVAQRRGIKINTDVLRAAFPEAQFVEANPRVGLGKSRILNALNSIGKRSATSVSICEMDDIESQEKETISRYATIRKIVSKAEIRQETSQFKSKWDKILIR